MSTHVLSLLVEDKPGLLTRVAGLFARRGFNIESLAVGVTEVPGLSRITVVVEDADAPDAEIELLTGLHNAAVANGLVGAARRYARRIDALEVVKLSDPPGKMEP